MTTLFERPLAEPATHAFVVGVGDYPHREPDWGGLPDLTNVPNIPSAADSAKFMCDWLLQNQDRLSAKLGSLEVLISDPAGAGDRYAWTPGKPVDRASAENVMEAGKDWLARLRGKPGDVALFYCCGHGAAHSAQPVLFLEDLNSSDDNPWVHLNLGNLAQSLRRETSIRCAFLFSDACGEFIPNFEISNPIEARFFRDPRLFGSPRDKVLLLCAAPEKLLAYEGEANPGDNVRFGRFTQTLLKGLDGSSARLRGNQWTVYPSELINDLKNLRRIFYGHWSDLPFEPSPVLTQNEIYPIIDLVAPELPVLIMTDPEEAMASFNLHVSERNDRAPPWIASKPDLSTAAWRTTVKAGMTPLYALAIADTDAPFYSSCFLPIQPIFDQRVSVR